MYMVQAFNVNIMAVGTSVFAIYGVGVFGALFSGAVIDFFLVRGYSRNRIIKGNMACLGVLMATFMYLLTTVETIFLATVCLALALFCVEWMASITWTMPPVISQRGDIGVVAAAMNTVGNLAGVFMPILLGFIVTLSGGDYYWALLSFVGFALAIPVFGFLVDLGRKVTA